MKRTALVETNILTLMEDNAHTLWLAQPPTVFLRAWVQYNGNDITQIQFRNYDERDAAEGRRIQ